MVANANYTLLHYASNTISGLSNFEYQHRWVDIVPLSVIIFICHHFHPCPSHWEQPSGNLVLADQTKTIFSHLRHQKKILGLMLNKNNIAWSKQNGLPFKDTQWMDLRGITMARSSIWWVWIFRVAELYHTFIVLCLRGKKLLQQFHGQQSFFSLQ